MQLGSLLRVSALCCWWFFKRQKKGAYMSVAAHTLGFGAALIQMPDALFEFMSPPMLALMLLLMFAVALSPILAFKNQYS
jgi:hypothetical protein